MDSISFYSHLNQQSVVVQVEVTSFASMDREQRHTLNDGTSCPGIFHQSEHSVARNNQRTSPRNPTNRNTPYKNDQRTTATQQRNIANKNGPIRETRPRNPTRTPLYKYWPVRERPPRNLANQNTPYKNLPMRQLRTGTAFLSLLHLNH